MGVACSPTRDTTIAVIVIARLSLTVIYWRKFYTNNKDNEIIVYKSREDGNWVLTRHEESLSVTATVSVAARLGQDSEGRAAFLFP